MNKYAKAFNTQDLLNEIRPGVGQTGTSIFDPVLTELIYRWFCPTGGLTLDPFAGGSVRGIIAAKLGRGYLGIDLRAEQIQANYDQSGAILADLDLTDRPIWIEGDAREILPKLRQPVPTRGGWAAIEHGADLFFTCPPYGDLERYSDDPRDLSNFSQGDFEAALAEIIAKGVALLKPDRFAAIVCGDYRDANGYYQNFPGRVAEMFIKAGARLYNEAILITAIGRPPIRAGKQFEKSRKFGKTHQNVYIFCDGDPVAATQACGPCESGEMIDGIQPSDSENPGPDHGGAESFG